MKYLPLDAKQQSINSTKRISFLSLNHSRPHNTEQRTRKHVIGQNEEHAPYQHLGRFQILCSTTDNRHVTLVTNLVTIYERLKEDRIVTTSQIIRTC
jgi:hypothetical protein